MQCVAAGKPQRHRRVQRDQRAARAGEVGKWAFLFHQRHADANPPVRVVGFAQDDRGDAGAIGPGFVALGSALASTTAPKADPAQVAEVDLVTPVDLYSEINRSVKYGFLFIGFTFLMFWLFDVVGGVAVATVEYLLAGAGLVLFFVMLLAFAEVIGFALAYLVAAGAIVGLLAAYSAAVLASRKRAGVVAVLLAALYAVLYVLLGLEAYSLLIGSLLLFAGLAATMWLTRRIDWQGTAQRDPAGG